MDRVVERFRKWALGREIAGMRLEVVRLGNRTPLLFIEIPGDSDDTVLLYGHMDKQPEMAGWRAGLDPWTAGDRERSPLRARRRRRRLRDVRVPGRDRRAPGAEDRACADGRDYRGVRGKRQLRSSRTTSNILRRESGSRAWSSRWTPDAATTSSYGVRLRCAGWSAARSRSQVLTEGCIRATRAEWCRQFPHRAPYFRGSRTKKPARYCRRVSRRDSRGANRDRRAPPPPILGDEYPRQVSVPPGKTPRVRTPTRPS